ncbi:hypothetical protein C2S52_010091 [Perilla frutescens var. hirtella]|nr:hypothetical protein C2S52_010091 [Perilla frutescens var. hirtella]
MCSYKPAIVGLGGIGKYRRCHEGLVRPPLESDGWRLDSTLTYWRSSYSKPSFWMRQWWIGGASLTLLLGRASSEDESLVDEIVMPSLLMIGAYAGRGPVKSWDSVTCTRTIGWHTSDSSSAGPDCEFVRVVFHSMSKHIPYICAKAGITPVKNNISQAFTGNLEVVLEANTPGKWYIECIVRNLDLSSIIPSICAFWRKSYCSNLFEFGMDVIRSRSVVGRRS